MTARMISSENLTLITTKGKYYPQETNQFGMPMRQVFCDHCSRSGITGSWKVHELPDIDICMQCYINLHHQQNNVLNSNQQPAFHPLMPDLHLQPQPQSLNGGNSWNAWNGGSGIADYNQVWNQDAGIPNSYANLIIDNSRSNHNGNNMSMGRENNYTSTKYNAPEYNNKRW